MLFQESHVLLYDLGTFIKGGISIKESTGRLFVDEGIGVCYASEKRVIHQKLMKTVHSPIIQQATGHKYHAASYFPWVFHIINLFS